MKQVFAAGAHICLILLLSSCDFQIGTEYSKKRAIAAYRTEVTQYGVKWEFDSQYPTGQFANGDYWVVGPVNIIDITPRSVVVSGGRVINGSMLNPAIILAQGYDSMIMGRTDSYYDPSLNVGRPKGAGISSANPLKIRTPSSLISAISSELDGIQPCRVSVMAVLTILDAVPEEGAFRPCYAGTDKRIRHSLSEVDLSSLPKLATPASSAPSIVAIADRFKLPWIEHFPSWLKQLFSPSENMPNYGATIADYVSDAALMLCLDVDDAGKRLLATRIIQLGLDNYGVSQLPGGLSNWTANGGHMSGRAFPIVFAASLLNDREMLNAMKKTGQYAYTGTYHEGNLPPDYLHFGETDQTFFVTQRDINRMAGGITPGVWEPDPRAPAEAYLQTDLGIADWGFSHAGYPAGDNKNIDAEYRPVNSPPWAGFVLASRILGLMDAWNHPALFGYLDRWMAYPGKSAQNQFQTDMWNLYRSSY
jgi:hypothetical protein